MAESSRTPEGPGSRHLRLAGFFLGLAVLGAGGGTLLLFGLAGEREGLAQNRAAAVLTGSVVAVCLLGFLGVFLHRLYVLPQKQREIERYLLRIERESAKQRALEQQLRLNERLGSLGLLTASVAHEINNPLEGIGNYLSLLARPELTPEQRTRYLEQVQHGFGLIRDLVRDLLRFSRPGVESGQADLRQVAERALRLAALAEVCKEVAIVLEAPDEPVMVFGDARRLEQLVLNLLLNAGKAMQGRGRVLVRIGRAEDEEVLAELVVADEGPGIREADLERLFDPFFTTGDGTGLGLSIAYGIVRAHGGTIAVRNRPEGGAEFAVRLPTSGEESRAPEARS